MHAGHQIPSQSTTSSPHHANTQIPSMVELHSAIPHSAQLSDIDDEETENEHIYKHHKSSHNSHIPIHTSNHKHKSNIHNLKSIKNTLKHANKYNTLQTHTKHKNPSNLRHQTTNSSSSASSQSQSHSNTDSPPIHPLQITENKNKNKSTNTQFEPGYTRWKGQNSIFCNGRIIAGPETKKQIRTFILILVPVIIYFATTCVILWTEYTHMRYTVIIAIALFVCVVIFFLTVSCIDPGIIPRPEIYEKSVQSTDVINYISRHEHESTAINAETQINPPWEQRINIDGNIRILKYCYTCHHFRPPRSFHCNNCDCCIERFDHHCPWLGNCIAKRNYHFYILFLLSVNAMCVWVAWTSLFIVMDRRDSFVRLWRTQSWPMITLTMAGCAIIFPSILLTFHCYLIGTGQTTNEKAKNAFPFVSPYSRGCVGNVCEVFCVVSAVSNVHIAHRPPKTEQNECIVNKRKIVYISEAMTANVSGKAKSENNLSLKSNESQQLLHVNGKNIDKKTQNHIIEEEMAMENSNDSSMDNNDTTQTSDNGPLDISANHIESDEFETNIIERTDVQTKVRKKRRKNRYLQPQIHHTNIGSNSSADHSRNVNIGLNHSYATHAQRSSKLKRKRERNTNANNPNYHRSHSNYSTAQYRNHQKRGRYSHNNNTHYSDAVSHAQSERNQISIQSERVYTHSHSTHYHPAYYKHMSQNQCAFSPLSPANVPYYPSPQNANMKLTPVNYDRITPVFSNTNEDIRTLDSSGNTFNRNNLKNSRNRHLHRQYKAGTDSNNNTLFSPELSNSDSDFYNTTVGPSHLSHAHTYHRNNTNNNPFADTHSGPPPPSSVGIVHRSHSNYTHKRGKPNRSYNVNDILELSSASRHNNKYRNYQNQSSSHNRHYSNHYKRKGID